jgi:hypothetical protein
VIGKSPSRKSHSALKSAVAFLFLLRHTEKLRPCCGLVQLRGLQQHWYICWLVQIWAWYLYQLVQLPAFSRPGKNTCFWLDAQVWHGFCIMIHV